MKAILAGILAAAALAVAAAAVLDAEVQRTVQQQYHTEGVRL
jgi:hypothetical protein